MAQYSYYYYSGNYTEESDHGVFIPLLLSYSIVFITGVFGNAIVLISIYKSRRLHTITCIFLANLAIVDFIVCLLVVPLQIGQEFIKHWPYGLALCKMVSYLMLINPTCSVFTLTLISFERFYVVLYPLKAKSVLTFRRAKIALLVVWVSTCVFSVPNIFKQTLVPWREYSVCRIGWESYSLEYKMYTIFNLLFLLIIPVTMMTIAYASVIHALYKNKEATAGRKQSSPCRPSLSCYNGTRLEVIQNDDDSSTTSTLMSDFSPARMPNRDRNVSPVRGAIIHKHPSKNASARWTPRNKRKAQKLRFMVGEENGQRDEDADKIKRIVLMLVIIVLLFVLCWTPVLVINVLQRFQVISLSEHTNFILSSTTHLLAFSNSCFNPFLYALLSKNFRESMKQVFKQCCWRNHETGIRYRPSVSSTRVSRSGTHSPRWKHLRNGNGIREDHV